MILDKLQYYLVHQKIDVYLQAGQEVYDQNLNLVVSN